jgi:hypothetical protein
VVSQISLSSLEAFKNNLDKVRQAPEAIFQQAITNHSFSALEQHLYPDYQQQLDYCQKIYPLEKDGLSASNFKFWFENYFGTSGNVPDQEQIDVLCHHLKADYIPVLFDHPQGMFLFQHYSFYTNLIEDNNLKTIEKIFNLFTEQFEELDIIRQSNLKNMLLHFYCKSYCTYNEEILALTYSCMQKTNNMDIITNSDSLFENAEYLKALIRLNPEVYFPKNPVFLNNLILDWSISGNFEDDSEFAWVLDYGISHIHHHHDIKSLLDLWHELKFEHHDAALCHCLLEAIDTYAPERVSQLDNIFQKTDNVQIKNMVMRYRLNQNLVEELLENNSDFSDNHTLKIKI